MAKFYNPFKAHIIEFNGEYFVRKLTLLGWAYKSNNTDYWYHFKLDYVAHKSYRAAVATLNRTSLAKSLAKAKKIHG